MEEADIEAGPTSPPLARPRLDSGLGLGLFETETRPISSVSAKSAVSTGGNTLYHSAQSSIVAFPVPVTAPERQEELIHSPAGESAAFRGPPPSYDVPQSVSPGRGERPPSEIDILDEPVPTRAASLGSGSQPAVPPGLGTIPRSWRDSYTTDDLDSGEAVRIEDEPPSPNDGWRSIAGERIGRRQTFGIVRTSHESMYELY